MKIRMMDSMENGNVVYEGEMDLDRLNEFKHHWEDEMSGRYHNYVVSYEIGEDGILCFYPDGPWEC